MDPFFTWLEDSALSEWIRSSSSLLAFPGILVAHALGMAFLVGGNLAIDLRLLGFASRLPVRTLQGFFPLLWLGLALNVASGVLLVVAYPTKALTNPVFFLKLFLIVVGLICLRMIMRDVFRGPVADSPVLTARVKILAALSLICWLGTITAGRFLAYTYSRLMVDSPVRGQMDTIAPWELWVRSTWLHQFIHDNYWLWPVAESLHFIGLSLLIGTVGLFDLRVLGMAKSIPPYTMHRLIPFGIAGYLINLCTGIVFFFGFPEQYAYNRAFHFKLVFMTLAGLNMVLFYSAAFRQVRGMGAGEDAPRRAKILTGISLLSWLGVLICGRLLTFFRPPFFH